MSCGACVAKGENAFVNQAMNDPNDEGTTILRNVGKYSLSDTAYR